MEATSLSLVPFLASTTSSRNLVALHLQRWDLVREHPISNLLFLVAFLELCERWMDSLHVLCLDKTRILASSLVAQGNADCHWYHGFYRAYHRLSIKASKGCSSLGPPFQPDSWIR